MGPRGRDKRDPPVRSRNGRDARCPSGVINRRESYQQPLAACPKKAEGKRELPPCTPYGEKGRGKKLDGVSKGTRLSRGRTGARAGVRALVAAEVDAAVGAFHGSAEDRRIWASIAWRVGVEEFHFALMDKLAEDAADGTRNIRSRAAAFQAFLNARFPKAVRTRATGKMPVVPVPPTSTGKMPVVPVEGGAA